MYSLFVVVIFYRANRRRARKKIEDDRAMDVFTLIIIVGVYAKETLLICGSVLHVL